MTTTNEPQTDTYNPALLAGIDTDVPLLTAADVVELAARLVQTAHRRQWWLLLLDADGHLTPAFPKLEMPRRFGEREADRIAEVLAGLLVETRGQLALVWEDPDADDAASEVGPSLLHAAMTRLGGELLAQVVVRRDFRVAAWEPPTSVID